MADAHTKYLLREGHLLGFFMGLALSRWWWAAVPWGVLVLALWIYSAVRDESGRTGSHSGGPTDG
jgi:hypothetical protein